MSNTALKQQITDLLFADIAKFWLNLYRQKYLNLVEELAQWPLLQNRPEQEDEQSWLMLQSIAFLQHSINQRCVRLQQLESGQRSFVERLNHAELQLEKEFHILRYAEELGASRTQLQGDKQALQRWLDASAMTARYQDQVAELEQSLKFLIGKLGDIAKRYLRRDPSAMAFSWQKLDLQNYFINLLNTQGNSHLRNSLFRALVNLGALLHDAGSELELHAELAAHLVQALEQPDTPYQAIIDILEILIQQRPTFVRAHMWAAISGSELLADGKPNNPDELFMQCAFARILASQPTLSSKDEQLLLALAAHCYPSVRQSVLEQLHALPLPLCEQILAARFAAESLIAVRLTLVKQLCDFRLGEGELLWPWWQALLSDNEPLAVKRYCLELTARMLLNMQSHSDRPELLHQRFLGYLNHRLEVEPEIAVRRYIARTREQLVGFALQSAMVKLEQHLASADTVIKISQSEFSAELLGRLLSIKAQAKIAFNVTSHKGYWLVRKDYHYGFRLWRFWHELTHPSTDKRQSYSHTTARKPSAEIFVPSCTIAELSETQVPGEPLFDNKDHSTRPYLPLPDHLLSVLSQDNVPSPSLCFTPDGILLLTRPASFITRLKSYFQISLRFAELDRLRKGNAVEQQHYLAAIQQYGFECQFKAYGAVLEQPTPIERSIVERFQRPLSSLSLTGFNLWLSFKEYSVSIYQNSIGQLMFFVVAFITYFWTRHVHVGRKIKRNRRAIPISIGGWGTRGKSGTERLKAALFSSLALRVVSKTTGCEAMMIYTKSSGEQFEIPLFRPFEKASIWEQHDVLEFAKNVRADVFLWECMGLNPRYVKILRRWMQDNFATITNAYPDHEDILGPRGVDVAKEIGAFIGERSQVFTAEQSMMPVLEQDALTKHTSLIQVHWSDGLQISPEIRALYPYDEHPDNIALVCKMAAYIGISKDRVYKETAARIVPDVGVLRHFGPAKVAHLTQSFVSGMSANERLATLDNWHRLGLDAVSAEPLRQSVALINNRADRVARSKVFAQLLAQDLSFELLVVVGSNVDGFATYLRQALEERLQRAISNQDKDEITALFRHLKIADHEQYWLNKWQLLLAPELDHQATLTDVPMWLNAAELSVTQFAFINNQLALLHSWYRITQTGKIENSAAELAALLSQWQACRCIEVTDSYISADQLALTIASHGLSKQHQLIFGMQNIKGPGLSFVNAWQKWQRMQQTLSTLLSDKQTSVPFRRLLTGILQEPEYNLLTQQLLTDNLPLLQKSPLAQSEFVQAELGQLTLRLAADNKQNATTSNESHAVLRFVAQVIESFLDAGAAVKRKKTALQIYQDIAAKRITVEKAVSLLRDLNRSQKPGWLYLKWQAKTNKK
ncbi:poly-gamma-glutamate synthase PgsB [Pseudoalteromonas fenneropenaei]|uniref:Poly-gamma-glutamate synthase PgsB n=1 Tax=Pseudoalteromonas fenneropenaei TaxID=1737459 RepID=A0ABV7CL83_9GAMM